MLMENIKENIKNDEEDIKNGEKELIVNEIFKSVQGEGPYTGIQMIFIRLTGCNLRCKWCDTKYAFYEGKKMRIDEIMSEISKYNLKWVCITGGEPLIQKNTKLLVKELIKNNYNILFETNGTLPIVDISNYENIYFDVDFKLPSSDEFDKFFYPNLLYLGKKDYIKFTIGDKVDFNIAIKKIAEFKKTNKDVLYILQPVYNTTYLKDNFLNYNFDDKVRLMIQTHKVLWGDKRGI